MSTYDHIINPKPKPAPKKGTYDWHKETQPDAEFTQSRLAESVPNSPSAQVGIKTPDKLSAPQQSAPMVPNPASSQVQINRGPEQLAPRQMTMSEMYEKLNAAKRPLSPEEVEVQRKKERRDKMFASISDGIQAISNLVATTRYAPNAYDGNNTMSERTRLRYDRLRKEREAAEAEYNAGLLKAREYDAAQALQAEREKRAAERDARDKDAHNINMRLKGQQVKGAEADARRKAIEADYAPQMQNARLETEKNRANAQKASASASYARASQIKSGRADNHKGKPLTVHGVTTYYDTEEEYKKAVIRAARENQIATKEKKNTERTEESTSPGGRTQQRKSTQVEDVDISIDRLAGIVEEQTNRKPSKLDKYKRKTANKSNNKGGGTPPPLN